MKDDRDSSQEEIDFWQRIFGKVELGPPHQDGGQLVYFREIFRRLCVLAGVDDPPKRLGLEAPGSVPKPEAKTPQPAPPGSLQTLPVPSEGTSLVTGCLQCQCSAKELLAEGHRPGCHERRP